MFELLKLREAERRFHWSIAFCRTPMAVLFVALAVALHSCQDDTDNTPITPPAVNDTIVTYVPPQSSDLFKDTRLREQRPTQTQGTLPTLIIGDEGGTTLDYLVMDSSVVYLDSIPTGREIVSCTLWIKINRLPTQDGDVITLDLWSVPEPWNENEASWLNRMSSLAWQTAGGGGGLIESQLVSLKKLNNFDFIWTVRGQLFDTLRVEDAQFLPIPISDSLAVANYNGLSFGFALRVNPATSPAAFMGIVSAEASAVANRPFLEWYYR